MAFFINQIRDGKSTIVSDKLSREEFLGYVQDIVTQQFRITSVCVTYDELKDNWCSCGHYLVQDAESIWLYEKKEDENLGWYWYYFARTPAFVINIVSEWKLIEYVPPNYDDEFVVVPREDKHSECDCHEKSDNIVEEFEEIVRQDFTPEVENVASTARHNVDSELEVGDHHEEANDIVSELGNIGSNAHHEELNDIVSELENIVGKTICTEIFKTNE